MNEPRFQRWEDLPLFLSSSQVGELFNISPYQLRKEAEAGLLERARVGRFWRYSRAGLIKYCRQQGIDPWGGR